MSGFACHQDREYEPPTLTYLLGVGIDVLEAHRHKGVVLLNTVVGTLRGLGRRLGSHVDVWICVLLG